MTVDLTGTRECIVASERSAASLIEESLAAAQSPAGRAAFLRIDASGARAAARAADDDVAAGRDPGALAGLAVSVKDLFDVAGDVTTAGSTALSDRPAATADAPAVARLRAAGAAIVGRTHMTEFAFSGVGLNPHHPVLANPATAALDAQARIPGGSTSGGAASVAIGAAWAALGSDTGGSIRIPAALQGLVGFKNTARLVSTDGAVPLSTTLDTACAVTRSVRDAIVVHEVLAARRVSIVERPLAQWRFAVPRTLMLDGLDADVARAFEAALATLSRHGATPVEIDLPALSELASIHAAGSFAAAESWAWHRELIERFESEYDPRVATRIRRGETMTRADIAALHDARRRWIADVGAAIAPYDALLSPTVPIVAPEIAPLLASDDAFFAANAALLRNPSAVNFLDGCAISLPCQAPGTLPVGLMLWHGAMQDDRLLAAALAVERALARG